ncbi:hypothetical protein PGIGA_G00137890 [Pangasianodon gigas]|uniref:Uncharacterized protein n=1 Tax=Pangasianodon gigas TaxID=30993 RepID=A0ACC5XKW5_PANGG|nr:hypothetical protein [Pangasianodon gigas]
MNEKRNNLASLLHAAVNETDVRTVESLLQRGADPNLVLDEGVAAVHLAAGKESEKGLRCLKVLLQSGADPNLRSGEDLTPLHIAAVWGCYQNLKLLLKNGGDPSLRDQGGNKAVDLAEQEENSKCASILQEFESQTLEPEYEDLPKFHYSLHSGHSMRDLMLMSDFGDEPLSSTRYSSFYRKSESDGLRRATDLHGSWLSEVSGFNARESDMFKKEEVGGSLPPVLSSTRLSGMDFKKSPEVAQSARFFTPSRKSVTFRDYDEYFPDLKQNNDDTSDSRDSTVDFSRYPDFLNSERMTTVLQNQGIDVTSPDEVFVFCREGNTTEDFDKTVVGGLALGEEDEDNADDVFVDKVDELRCVTHAAVSSNSGSSQYSSCDSEPYKTTIEAPLPSENISPPEKDGWTKESSDSDSGKKEELNLQSQACDDKINEISFTPSPFVTGRTRSRLSRCSQRNSTSSFSTSSLFEQTLPTPTRVHRNVTHSDKPQRRRPSEDDRVAELDSHMASLCVSSQLHGSQADTLIISGSMADTIIIPRGATDESLERGTSSSSCHQEEDVFTEDKEFLTSDVSTSSSEIHKNTNSQDSSSSSESSSSLSQALEIPSTGCTPRYSMSRICNHSQPQSLANLSYTPGGRPLITDMDEPVDLSQALEIPSTGCTPRYSMSRICNHSQPQSLANLSYTPGGRPLITDMDEPVEYLYTDTEEGHELIETHVPPTSNTSLSSSVSEETVIYDWRSLQTATKSPEKGKENRCPNEVEERANVSEMEGLTDRELRRKLVELGEKPGPINRDTRQLYIQRLQTLQKKHVTQKSVQDEPTAVTGYSPELNKVLGLFHLPDCKADEFALCEQFDQPDQNKRWREGVIKSSFNYLLLDPSLSQALEIPSTGCTPRYSMSRICNHSQPQSLANLSYTPGGRPLITDMDEPVEYLYTDTEEGHELIETHVPPTSNTSLSSSVSEETVIYDWRSLQTATKSPEKGKENRCPNEVEERANVSEMEGLTDRELRRKLVELGEKPGPINRDTRQLYIQRLQTLQKKHVTQKSVQDEPTAVTGYSPELNKVLGLFHLPDCKADEFALCEQFDQPDQNKRWREGVIKSSFNYLLLDPRVTKNLPYRSQSMTPHECFQTFISSIFYVGKGKRSRPYSHLYEALEYFRGDKSSKKLCLKVQHILQVWNCGHGVVSLHCFQNVIPVEAYTREACMVDAIGLKMLTNQKRGDYYGMVSTWAAKRQRELGAHLLYRAMQIFLAEGERQLRPADIRR